MPLINLKFPSGIRAHGTDLESTGQWLEGNLVRWEGDSLRPVGGWELRNATVTTGVPSGAHAWVDNTGNYWIAVGTVNELFSINEAGTATNITPVGLVSDTEPTNTGYGDGAYGVDDYSVPTQYTGIEGEVATWSLDNWGEYLVACSNYDGKIYEWQLTGLPTALTNAPVNNRGILVTEERFIFALGSGGNPRKISWCDREDNTTWTPTATNEAGDIELQTAGQIMLGIRIRGRALLLTNLDAHIATYIGPPYVYGFERVGTACGAISRRCAAAFDNGAMWMGRSSFFMFDGTAVRPMICPVSDYVFDDLNTTLTSKAHAVHNEQFGEVWFFYVSSAANEIDKYVVYDYREDNWSVGTLERTTCIPSGVFTKPIWFDASGNAYTHEQNWDHGAESCYIESGPVYIGNGDNVLSAVMLIPDERTEGEVTATFKTRLYPNAAESSHGPYTLSTTTDVRFTGRQVRIRIDGINNNNWRVGLMRLDVRESGQR